MSLTKDVGLLGLLGQLDTYAGSELFPCGIIGGIYVATVGLLVSPNHLHKSHLSHKSHFHTSIIPSSNWPLGRATTQLSQ